MENVDQPTLPGPSRVAILLKQAHQHKLVILRAQGAWKRLPSMTPLWGGVQSPAGFVGCGVGIAGG